MKTIKSWIKEREKFIASGRQGVGNCVDATCWLDATMKILNSRDYPVRAWTGGSAPTKKDWRTNAKLRAITRYLFEKQHVESGIPLDYWACAGTSALERARILWNRAKLDAFATLGLN